VREETVYGERKGVEGDERGNGKRRGLNRRRRGMEGGMARATGDPTGNWKPTKAERKGHDQYRLYET